MRYLIRIVGVLASAFSLLVGAPAVLAHADEGGDGGHAVFVQTNATAGNSIDVFARGAGGGLSYVATYATGGNGGREHGAAVDPLASQSSLVYDAGHRLLFAVNAGSNSVSVFGVQGTSLHLNQVIGSGGSFPSSIAVRDSIAYVLNAGSGGSVQGYSIDSNRLQPIEGSSRSLNLQNSDPLFFLTTPAQIGFTPDGGHLVVTLKGNNGGSVDVFNLSASGRPSGQPRNTSVGGNAFAFSFDPAGQLALVNAGGGNLSTYTVNGNGSLSLVSAGLTDGQAAACWVTPIRGFYVVANAGSGDLSEYTINSGGAVTLTNATATPPKSIPGAVDAAASGDFVYAQSGGSHSIKGYAINDDGSLTLIGSWDPGNLADQEGIAAA